MCSWSNPKGGGSNPPIRYMPELLTGASGKKKRAELTSAQEKKEVLYADVAELA